MSSEQKSLPAEALLLTQEQLASESESEDAKSDLSGEEREDEQMDFELRLDPIEDNYDEMPSGCRMPSFSVVEFVDKVNVNDCKTVDIIPSVWFKGTDGKLCWWPPATFLNVTKAVKEGTPPDKTWILCSVRVMGTAATYADARVKLHQAEYSSDLTDTEDGSRKRKPRAKLLQSQASNQPESSEHSDSEKKLPSSPPEKLDVPSGEKKLRRSARKASTVARQVASPSEYSSDLTDTEDGSRKRKPRAKLLQSQASNQPESSEHSDSEKKLPSSPPEKLLEQSGEKKIRRSAQKASAFTVQQIASPSAEQFVSSSIQQVNGHTAYRFVSSTVRQVTSLTVAGPVVQQVASSSGEEFDSPTAQKMGISTVQTVASSSYEAMFSQLLLLVEEIKETQRVHGEMLNRLLKKKDAPAIEVPEGVVFPLKTHADVEALHEKLEDCSLMSAVVAVVADVGGTSLDEATRRMMKYILSNELALEYNVFGRHGKRKFKDLRIFSVLYEALKKNALTAEVNQQDAERALSKWFVGARDRGGQRAARMHPKQT